MRRDLMDILACPVCKGRLTLEVEHEVSADVVRGSLHCETCPHTYPIEDGIPNLLPPERDPQPAPSQEAAP